MAAGVGVKDSGSLNPRQVKMLKTAIAVMGVLIVLCVLALIGRFFWLMGRPAPGVTTVSGTVAATPRLTLPAGTTVRTVSLSGDRLAVQYDAPTGSGIAILDIASGRTLSRVELVPEPPR